MKLNEIKTDGKLYFLNANKVMCSAMGVRKLPDTDKLDVDTEVLRKVFNLTKKLWLSKSKVIKKRYFTTIDVGNVDLSNYEKVVDVKNEVIDLMNCSRISEDIGNTCLKFLCCFYTFKLSTNPDGSERPEFNTSDFVEFNGEIYVTKAAVSETIQGFVTMYEQIENKSRDKTDKLH
jgi:hypothetical protein